MNTRAPVEITTRSLPNGPTAFYVSFYATDQDGRRVRIRMRAVDGAHAQEIAHRIERGMEYVETFVED